MNSLKIRLKGLLTSKSKRFHRDEGGAVFLMVLAAVLILFMVSLSLFDTGNAASDKMMVQVSADTASYSHAVVKARSMNTIVFANIIKRMYYSYQVMYSLTWINVYVAAAAELVICIASWGSKCESFLELLVLIVAELLEEANGNAKTLSAFKDEIAGLEQYQTYMTQITPWWAYVEGITVGSNNGALLTTNWPPPPTSVTYIMQKVVELAGLADDMLGMNIKDMLPLISDHEDMLPLARRDLAGKGEGKSKYCKEYFGSWEHIIHATQAILTSDNIGAFFNVGTRTLALIVAPALGGCGNAHKKFKPKYLDWRILDNLTGADENKNAWAQATSSISLAYRPRAGRNTSERKKYGYLKGDHTTKNNSLYTNEGYFALSRSEIVYAPVVEESSGLKFVAKFLGANSDPDMWSPRWKGKGRPFLVPGENLGSTLTEDTASLATVIDDSVPLLALSSLIGLTSDQFTFSSAWKDLVYLVHSGHTTGPGGGGFSSTNLSGVPK